LLGTEYRVPGDATPLVLTTQYPELSARNLGPWSLPATPAYGTVPPLFLDVYSRPDAMDTFSTDESIVSLDPETPFWDRFHMVAPLVVIGTKDEEGTVNLAPKHMATPMGWRDYFGFVCTPRHKTFRNAKHTGVFTVSYPRPSQVVLTSLAAAPRDDIHDGPATKSSLDQLPTRASEIVDGVFLDDAYLFLECEIDQIVDNLGENSLLIGRVAGVHVHQDLLRTTEQDEDAEFRDHPLLAYVPPDRYATIDETYAFPFPTGFSK